MRELDDIARDVRSELGEPPASWLRNQRQELRRALTPASRPRRVLPRRWLLAAALLATTLSVVTFVTLRPTRSPQSNQEMVLNAPSGARRVNLDDGSTLVLTQLSLARVHRAPETTRCVVEVGTVDFEIAPQKGRVFTVVAGAFEIRVIGTRFSVARNSAGVVEVRVDHGVVRVLAPSRSAPIELEAGDRLRSDDAGLSLTHAAQAFGSPSAVTRAEPLAPTPEASPSAVTSVGKASPIAPRSDWQALYREHNYAAALEAARQSGVENLLASLGATGLAELADAARLGGDSELAMRAFGAVMRRFPDTPQARDATFLSGRLHAARGDMATARARFERYLAQNPNGAYSLEATGRLVEIYAARGDARAKDIAKSYLERAPNGPYQRLCRSVLAAP